MKLKQVLYLIGIKPKPRTYDFRVDDYELEKDGHVQFANWLHPSARKKEIPQEHVDALRVFLSPGDTAIDVGCYVGDTAVPMALAVGAEGCVIGFEPNPYVFPVFEANTKLNPDKTNIIPVPCAASDADGKLVFSYSDPGYCNGGELKGVNKWRHAHAFTVEVDAVEADSYLRREFPEQISRLKYIKTDAEGADLFVLRQLAGIIDEFRPFVRSEIYRHTSSEDRTELFNFFLSRNYRVFEFEGLDNYKGRELSLSDVSQESHYDIFAVPS